MIEHYHNDHKIYKMGGLPIENPSSTISVQSQKDEGSATASKPKKKICCACPETKKLRDECIVQNCEDSCGKWIEAHRRCLRAEGFNGFQVKCYMKQLLRGLDHCHGCIQHTGEQGVVHKFYVVSKMVFLEFSSYCRLAVENFLLVEQ
ncbi:uncharacterized protein LOC127262774 [Andrographis paniculata]|uniref:uncharacterized protein LOC127262774 n=1 Tax=Andrographis paniculata TaxID=175694 RepID=UPI0021E6E58B|nr:uncharacterized protein LOC127262774 [Andrographis paniculata]